MIAARGICIIPLKVSNSQGMLYRRTSREETKRLAMPGNYLLNGRSKEWETLAGNTSIYQVQCY